MSLRPGRVALALTLSVLPAVAVVTTAAPSHAATSYTWTGTESSVWGNAANWSPSGIPTDGDTVLVAPAPSGRNAISGVPDLALAGLTVDGDVSLTGAGQVSAAQLQWTGGDLDLDLTVGNGSITQATTMLYGGARRTLTITGQVDVTTGSASTLEFRFDSNLRVADTGTLRLGTGVRLLSNRCCVGDTGTVVVNGTVEVDAPPGAPGTVRLDAFGLDLIGGTVLVPAGSTLEHVRGPVRVDDATATGGGTFQVTETTGDAFDPLHPLDPDGTLKFLDDGDTFTLADGSTLALGDFVAVSGVGRVTGDGSVRLAGPDVRGDLTLDVPASTAAGTLSRIVLWDDVRGQRGVLRPKGGLTIVPTSTLRVHSGTVLTVPDGARVALPGGATIGSDGCCSDPGRIVLSPAGTFAVGGGSATALLENITLGGSGQVIHSGRSAWDLAAQAFTSGARISGTGTIEGDLLTGAARVTPVGLLTVDGDYVPSSAGTYAPTLPASRTGTTAPSRLEVTGTARLAGALATRGATAFAPGHQVLALRAGTVAGRFRCTQAPGLLPVYSGGAVRLRAIEARVTGCLVPASGPVLRATFAGRRTASLGVPAGTDQVLLQVSLGKASRANTLTLAAGRGNVVLRAGARKAVTRLVVVTVTAARRLTATTTQRAAVTVTRVGRV